MRSYSGHSHGKITSQVTEGIHNPTFTLNVYFRISELLLTMQIKTRQQYLHNYWTKYSNFFHNYTSSTRSYWRISRKELIHGTKFVVSTVKQFINFREDVVALMHKLVYCLFYRDKNPRIGDIFVTKGPFLKLYTSYIREFENMTTGLDDARRKYPEFEKVCSDFEVICYLK